MSMSTSMSVGRGSNVTCARVAALTIPGDPKARLAGQARKVSACSIVFSCAYSLFVAEAGLY